MPMTWHAKRGCESDNRGRQSEQWPQECMEPMRVCIGHESVAEALNLEEQERREVCMKNL